MMPLQTMYNHQNNISHYQQQHQSTNTFGPSRVLDINYIRRMLGSSDNLSVQTCLSMAREAILHGFMEPERIIIAGLFCYKFHYNQMIFVLAEGFDAVVTIIWNQKNHLIGDQNSTFHLHTNYNQQFIAQQQAPQPQPVYVKTNEINPTPLRHAAIPYQAPLSNTNNTYNTYQAPPVTVLDEDSSEYECIIDEIVNFVDHDVDNDPDFADFHVLPPLPPPPHKTHQLQNQHSFYSINTDGDGDNHSDSPQLETHGIEIKITDSLYNELYSRYSFESKQELISLIQEAIHINRAPINQIGENKEWCVWCDRFYVYITENDMSTVIDIFDINQFQNHFNHCYQSLINRKHCFRGNKLIKNSSKRSVISNNSNNSNNSHNSSRRSVFSEVDQQKTNIKHEYHTIYLKPIIERMKQITYSMRDQSVSIDNLYIIDIVDNSIKYGVKRQISKRTFEFKWKSYTIIMSKSLKTILDVTLSNDKNIITVHPDVVSIISKKCPILDYFTIQKLANRAKLTASFTTKKNDYRQQFIYEYCGCRIVFASNHTTIVEMQCNDNSANNMKIIKDESNKY